MNMSEDKFSIAEWIQKTFGPKTPAEVALAALEEVIELCVDEKVPFQEIADRAGAALEHCRRQGKTGDPKLETADVGIHLLYHSYLRQYNLGSAVDAKMGLNRSRPQSYYDEKTKQKREIGLR